MAVKIRLARHGRKARPFYHIVAADSRAPRDGKYIAKLGTYNPMTNPATVELDFDQAIYWLQNGAQPTDTTRSILSKEGVMMKKHLLDGVRKGAFSEEEAETKFQKWQEEKNLKNIAAKDALAKSAADDKAARLEAEAKVSQKRADEIAKRKSDLAAEAEAAAKAAAEEAAGGEESAEAAEENTEA